MPGEVTMDTQSAVGSQDLKKDRSHAQQLASAYAPLSPQLVVNGGPIQAANSQIADGGPAPAQPPATNGVPAAAQTALAGPQNPPQLDQSWREHESYKSLGRVMERLAQKCYKDLNATLNKMSEIEIEPQQAQTNGIIPHAGEDTSEASRRKKRLLMDFAKEQRDSFVKLLVLSDWSHNEIDQGKLIDVKVWQDKQREAQSNAIRAVGQTKVNMIPAKVPAPNIQGATELLATGKASWTPDLGYIPPKRLTAKQLLKTLRNMNVVLATRLNLHEDLPPHLNDFTIADGRATFVVKDEFEVDLSVADEDPASLFYFIDIRLLFSPAPKTLNDRLRGPLEAKVNHELATNGLKGCYDFLHNFVISHKINVLRSQAFDLIRAKWFDCIRPESMRRSFIVQYWTGVPGPKNWIEIGVASGKKAAKLSREKATAEIGVRWFRRGKQITDEQFDFEWIDLDLEVCMLKVIAKHTGWILEDLLQRIRSLAGADSRTTAELTYSDDPKEPPFLVLKQESLRAPLEVRIEPVTGRFSITPPSQPAASVERHLNSTANVDAAKSITSLVGAIAQSRLHKEAELIGWTPTSNLARQDNLQKVFGEPVRHFSVFTPRKAWGKYWALAVTFTLNGEQFWTVSLEDKRDGQGTVAGKTVKTARRVLQPEPMMAGTAVSRADLLRMERLAVAEVAFSALAKQLQDKRIPYTLDRPTRGSTVRGGSRASDATAVFIKFSALMKSASGKVFKQWAQEPVRVTHHGIITDADGEETVRHDLRLTVGSGEINNLQKCITQHQEQDLALNSTGGLALRLQTSFGEGFVDQIQKRLESLARMDHWVGTVKQQGFVFSRVILSRLEFTYCEAPQLSAQLSLSRDGTLPVRLKFQPPDSNPHQRIRLMLEKDLNQPLEKGFEVFACLLRFTLPVLQTLQRLENNDSKKRTLVVHPRNACWYSIKYMAPLAPCTFQLRSKRTMEGSVVGLRWFLTPYNHNNIPEPLKQALSELWRGKADHWEGLKTEAQAGTRGVADLLEKVDEVIRKFPMPEQLSAPPTNEASDVPNTNAATISAAKHATVPTVQQTKTSASKPPPSKPPKDQPDVIMLD